MNDQMTFVLICSMKYYSQYPNSGNNLCSRVDDYIKKLCHVHIETYIHMYIHYEILSYKKR